MTTDDAVKILEAVGDSWPAAIVVASLVVGVIAWRALPRLREIVEVMKDVAHELKPHSGKSQRDAIDRIDKRCEETKEIGRASVRARGVQYVYISDVAVSLKKNTTDT